jgi:hypothetical protein
MAVVRRFPGMGMFRTVDRFLTSPLAVPRGESLPPGKNSLLAPIPAPPPRGRNPGNFQTASWPRFVGRWREKTETKKEVGKALELLFGRKIGLGSPANRADPIRGQIFKRSPRLDPAFRIAHCGVINIATNIADVLFHILFSFRILLSSRTALFIENKRMYFFPSCRARSPIGPEGYSA